MTVLVGLVIPGSSVLIGGDNAEIVNNETLMPCADLKMFPIICADDPACNIIVGHCGDVVIDNIARYALPDELRYDHWPVAPDGDLMPFIVRDLAPALRRLCEGRGVIKSENGIETILASLMVGVRGELFELASDFSVSRHTSDYLAAGSGMTYALGALYATASLSVTPRQRVRIALEAAAQHCTTVRGPFHVARLDRFGSYYVFD